MVPFCWALEVFEGSSHGGLHFWSLLLHWLSCFWIAALQKLQASLTSASSRWHFASSGSNCCFVDQIQNSGSCKYYFSYLQDCWSGSHLCCAVWSSHGGVCGNRVWTYSADFVAGNFLPWGESREAPAPAPCSVWMAEALDALQGGWCPTLSWLIYFRYQGSSFWRRGQEAVIIQHFGRCSWSCLDSVSLMALLLLTILELGIS